jgi:hypothetical protein
MDPPGGEGEGVQTLGFRGDRNVSGKAKQRLGVRTGTAGSP